MPIHELIERFEHPDPVFGPTPLWWWSGERVTVERLRWQLDRFHQGGINNLVVINLAPSGPTYGAPADDPAWFSEEWWRLLEDVCDHMHPLGMKLWFYDQIGFSGANLQGRITQRNSWARGEKLLAHRWVVQAGEGLPVPSGQRLVAVFDERRNHLGPFEGRDVHLCPGQQVLGVCAVPTSFDYLNPDAFALLLDLVHGEFERRVPHHLGRTIAGSFQDELPNTNGWTPAFPSVFASLRGYDLVPRLYHLFEGSSTEARKVRGDYYAVRTELTEQAVFRPLHAFHQRHGLLNGADQSNPARAAYPIQSTQIYTDYFRTHRWINAVGSDHEGDAHAHASLARLHGHDHVWIESFHSSGWGGTLEETWDWLIPFLRAGATLYNPHATYYSTVAGTFEWAPPSTDWRQPYWGQYNEFAKAVARTASVLSWGTFQARVGVLHPTTTVQAEVPIGTPIRYFTDMTGEPALPENLARTDATQDAYLELCGSTNWFKPLPGLLDAAGIGFDVVDDDSMQRATIGDGTLAVARQSYDTIVLPGCRVLETATAQALLNLLNRGGRVIAVGDRPDLAAGHAGDDDLVRRLGRHPDLILAATPQAAVEAIGNGRDVVISDVPVHARWDGILGAALIVAAHPMASWWDEQAGRRRLDFDRTRYVASRRVTITAPVARAELWIPSTGERQTLDVIRRDAGCVVNVPLNGAPAGLLVWTADPDGSHDDDDDDDQRMLGHTIDLQDGWSAELVPSLDNTWGDLSREDDDRLAAVQLWQLRDERDATVEAGFGEQALLVGPVSPPFEPLDASGAAAVRRGDRQLGAGTEKIITWSKSRGARRTRGSLGNKGEIRHEFMELPNPAEGSRATLRTLVTTDHMGAAELLVAAPAPLEVWWDGRRLASDETGPVRRFAVVLAGPKTHLLEYQIGPSDLRTDHRAESIGTWFTFTEPDAMPDLPVFMDAVGLEPVAGRITYSKQVNIGEGLHRASLVVGAAVAATVIVDGKVLAEQARVEYYDGGNASPALFGHDIADSLTPGGHSLQVALQTVDAREPVYIDLGLRYADRTEAITSGSGWVVTSGDLARRSCATRSVWGGLETAQAVRRPHPLPAGAWLRGEPDLGQPPLDFSCTTSVEPTATTLGVELPAGTYRVDVPTRSAGMLRIGDEDYQLTDQPVVLRSVLRTPTTAELRFAEVATPRGAALLDGPVFATVGSFDCPLRPWNELGLGSWSGGVTYRRTIELSEGEWILDLGGVRGSARIELDGQLIANLFCAPFRAVVPVGISGAHEMSITVFNTLAPFLSATTPTVFAFEEQLPSGLFGPVWLARRHGGARSNVGEHPRDPAPCTVDGRADDQ